MNVSKKSVILAVAALAASASFAFGELEVSLRPNAFVFIDLNSAASPGGDAMNR